MKSDRRAGRAREASASSRIGALAANCVLVALSLVASLLVLEVAWRLINSGLAGLAHWPNLARERMSLAADGSGTCAYAHDPTLGWTLRPNCTSPDFNVDADGFRRQPPPGPGAGPLGPILATGASFTLGQEVKDDESWPAYLQGDIGRPIVNAGVSGYSLDQTVLRTEALVARLRPGLVLVSFTPGDIRRSELKVAWSREKPYFAVVDGTLDLRNVPVPGYDHAPVPVPPMSRLIGWSTLADEIARRLGLYIGWYYSEERAVPAGAGETAACLMMKRLARLDATIVVIGQYGRTYWDGTPEVRHNQERVMGKVLGCAMQAGLRTIDLLAPLRPIVEAQGVPALYASDHHTAAGNRIVADILKAELARQGLPAPPAAAR